MSSFTAKQTIGDFQRFISEVYSEPNDRMFSVWDLLANFDRFSMRALKGIRKESLAKTKENLLISFSFLISVCNREHIQIEDRIWRRFPGVCSYCASAPCKCKLVKPEGRPVIVSDESKRPKTLADTQKMFETIYPAAARTLTHAGVHLAEEIGEVQEAFQIFLGEHRSEQFELIADEIADAISCIFGVANSIPFSMADELAKRYTDNCHICHHAPCTCSFTYVAEFKS